jgi:hypothetical protein
VQGVLVSITSAMMARYSSRVAQDLGKVIDRLGELATADQRGRSLRDIFDVDLPITIARWGGWANCVGVSTLVLIWLVFLVAG